MWQEGAQQCHLCRCSTDLLPTTCGRIPWAECTQSPKVKAENRETQMMPLLFSLGQHAALERVQRSLREGEVLFAFLDDVYTVSMPDRVCDIHRLLEEGVGQVRHPGA